MVDKENQVIRLRPYEYIHVMDRNTCEVMLVEGPRSFTMLDHHISLHDKVQNHVVVPPGHYCEVENPVVKPTASSSVGTLCNEMGHREVRLSQDPFPLHPGEKLVTEPQPMRILAANEAIAVRALKEFTYSVPALGGSNNGEKGDTTGVAVRRRAVGEVWLVRGPCEYVPRVEEVVEGNVTPIFLSAGQSLVLRANCNFTDINGVKRSRGDVWAVTTAGMHFPDPSASVVRVHEGVILSATEAVRVRALRSFFDRLAAVDRVAGERWLVTHDVVPLFIPTVDEEVEEKISLTIVGERQYCEILNVVKGGVCHYGVCEVRHGPCSFFLQPGEVLVGGTVREAHILSSDEALLVVAVRAFVDEDGVEREPASRWLVHGPRKYIPPQGVTVVERRKRMVLSGSEGVYVRDICTGNVRAVHGEAVLLGPEEELWEKPIDPLVHKLLTARRHSMYASRVCTETSVDVGSEGHPRTHKIVMFKVPHNALVQLYDPTTNKSRVEAGPLTVSLGPNEEISVVVLSGGQPKRRGHIHSLFLFLGPDFMADKIVVETLEHARLQLEIAYNWEFDTTDVEHIKRIAFSVPDFVGMACKTLANRIRAAIASEPFDNFHRNSSSLIRRAIFHSHSGTTELRGDSLYFPVNGLVITNVDVRSVEPVEVKMQNALTKSVQLAVEIITKSQENEASHQAMLMEQEEKGALELQLMKDRVSAEEERVKLLRVVAENTAIELCGASKAQALAESEARCVESQGELDVTGIRCEAQSLIAAAQLAGLRERVESKLCHRRAMDELAIAKAKALSDIDATKYEKIFEALGKGTFEAIARAGPELKAKLLQALGLKGFLVTDGSTPINLLGIADCVLHKNGNDALP
ncbi:major vault protein, putative [Trypanosoma equiperdum]|uniref:Major vault protein, putative n=2 Tax=Trypanozoon TaxID=39700 RepID=Q38C44_TRYB2|nr:major vault protein, putative [Trypanosoma brucei brucei TREU927]EAN77626.1 major vault protein, putative [Trypanosoma brucei brucei TREU927]SCU66931.1 major vault protein, putative [Trypanosoma equiperdum]